MSGYIRFGVLQVTMLFFLFLSSCATVHVEKGGEELNVVTFDAGPEKGFQIDQELTSVTEAVWKLTIAQGVEQSKRRKTGLKIVAHYDVLDRRGDLIDVEVNLSTIHILKKGKFIKAPFTQFSPPNPLRFTVNLLKRSADFRQVETSYHEWVRGLQETAVWDVMGGAFNVDLYLAQLEDLLTSPIVEFQGKTMHIGEEISEESTFFLPFLGPAISVGPVEILQKERLKGVTRYAGKDVGLIEGSQFTDQLIMSEKVLRSRMDLFDKEVPDYFEAEGEMGGKFRAKVEAGTGWVVDTSRRLHAISIINFKKGTLKEEVFGKKSVYEIE